MRIRYNIVYQSAALHVLDEAIEADMGVAVMRPITSGIFQRAAEYLAPEWHSARDPCFAIETDKYFTLGARVFSR